MELDRILRLPKVVEVTGLSVATLYRRMDEKTFPRPVRLGKNSIGWRQSVIQAWLEGLEEVADAAMPEGSGGGPRHPAVKRATGQLGGARHAKR
jgi:prophage regulatory protein